MPENNPPKKGLNRIRIITNVLTTALKLWLRSQVSQVSDLVVEIKASDRQLLSGCIPWVSIFANHAIYQDLHLTQIKLAAENIQVNIGQVLKGKPLQLMHVVPVTGELIIDETELNSSLSSELLSTALNDLLDLLLPEYSAKSKPILWQKIILSHQQVELNAIVTSASELLPLNIRLNLDLLSGNELQLSQIRVQQNQVTLIEGNDPQKVDLGSDVDIQELKLIPGQLICRGKANVNP
jgi:hypothetical protein